MYSQENQIRAWMKTRENAHLEFKEAKNNFDTNKLIQYCCALANERGGTILFGITDKLPRAIVGSQACRNLEKAKSELISNLRLRIEIEELNMEEKRIVVFTVPSRPIGVPIQYKGIYWMRRGEELVPMTPDMLKRIFNEAEPDFSAQKCPQAKMQDLSKEAINNFRELWARKSGNSSLKSISDKQLLQDIEVIIDNDITYAALILFGTHAALGKYLSHAELIFEYRSNSTTGPAQHRVEYRKGFFLFYNDLWEKINLRNEVQHFQDGLFIWDIPTFNEQVIREAILNAISHRDYRTSGSIWIRQFYRRITLTSPGGFLPGITPQNILWKQQPRNRRIAEVFAKCGLAERAGQGADRIFEESIKQGKPLPDFAHTDEHEVVLTLDGEIQDKIFLLFFEKIGLENLSKFTTEDFLVLDLVHKENPIPSYPPELKLRLARLVDLGIIECIGKGRGIRYMLCKKYYSLTGKSGVYTRKRGLDKETNKELLLKHIRSNASGAKFKELHQVVPYLSLDQVKQLLKEMKAGKLINVTGKTSASLWVPIS